MRRINMNKKVVSIMVSFLTLALTAVAQADPVAPATLPIVCVRDAGSTQPYSYTYYYQNDYISFSNSVMYTGSTSTSAVQNLDGCTIVVAVSRPSGVMYTNGYVVSTNLGTWGVEFLCPTQDPWYVEVTVSNVYNFTYPRYTLRSKTHL
jgi:hypothetical protein